MQSTQALMSIGITDLFVRTCVKHGSVSLLHGPGILIVNNACTGNKWYIPKILRQNQDLHMKNVIF